MDVDNVKKINGYARYSNHPDIKNSELSPLYYLKSCTNKFASGFWNTLTVVFRLFPFSKFVMIPQTEHDLMVKPLITFEEN